MRKDHERFVERGVAVIVAGPEESDAFRDYWQKEQLPFVGLPDPDHTVLDLYGQQVNLFKLGRMPAQFLIDAEGIVRYVHYARGMGDIPENSEILAMAEKIAGA